jgi:hypothetical protein
MKMKIGTNKQLTSLLIIITLLFTFSIYSYSQMNDYKYKYQNSLSVNRQIVRERELIRADFQQKITEQKEKYERTSFIDYTPPMETIKRILKESKIDQVEYDKENFNCIEFSYGLVQDFLSNNVYACTSYVLLKDDKAHSIVVLNSLEEGLIFVEPQNDKIMKELQPGDNYCEKAGWDCTNISEGSWDILKIKHCFSELDY